MHTSKRALSLILCLFLFLNAYSQETDFPDVQDILGTELYAQIQAENGKLSHFFIEQDEDSFKLTPKTQAGKEFSTKWQDTRDDTPNYTLENLYILKADENVSKDEEIEKLNKIIRSFSTLKGIEYYSNTRHKMDILYHDCYRIDNFEDRNRIPDFSGDYSGPLNIVFDDNSFGVYATRITYGQTENDIYLQNINVDSMGVPGIKAIKENNMLAFVDIVRCKEELVVYIYITAKASVSPIFKNMIYESFLARADALYSWLEKAY